MNNRIEQLANQAGFNTIWNGAHIVFDVSTKENMKEFAELLISAVMAEVKDEVQFQCGWANAEIVENRVKNVFGV